MNGIIFFENGQVAIFGQLTTVQRIADAAQTTLSQLLQQERDRVLRTVSKDELKYITERIATEDHKE